MLYVDNMNVEFNVTDDFDHLPSKIDEADLLTEEARTLIVGCKTALMEEGVREEALALERWLESYRRGISAAQKLSSTGPDLLSNIEMRLQQALAELERYESEGGNPATKSQQAHIEEINHALRAIQKLGTGLREASFVDMPRKANIR